MSLTIIIAGVSILLCAVFTATEKVFFTFNKLRYEVDKKQEKRYALLLEKLLERESDVIRSLRIAGDIFLVVFGICITVSFTKPLIGFAVALLSVVIIAKAIPVAAATINSGFIIRHVVYVAKGILTIFSPFIRKEERSAIIPIEREESSEMVIFQNALNFSEVKVRECMIPRTEIAAISEDACAEDLIDLFTESKYSRIIVFRNTIDTIVGYIHSKDLFSGMRSVKEMTRSIEYVSEEMNAQDLLAFLIKKRKSIAVVNDSYGGTAGIVTMEDLIEEIFGEIPDELDKEEELIEKKISWNEFVFSARLEVKYLNKAYDLDFPENDDYETLGGFITYFNESIPAERDILHYENYEFTILKTDSNRLESVAVRIME